MNREFFNEKILSPLQEWKSTRDFKNDHGTDLIGHRPDVAPKAYVNVVYAPLSPSDLNEFSERLERPIPDQYGEFLSYANGLMIFSGSLRVMGYVPNKSRIDTHIHNYPSNVMIPNVSARIKGLDHESVVVGFYKENGSYASIEHNGAVVRFDARGNGGKIDEWPDFSTWLSSEISVLNDAYKAGKVNVFIP